jgi:hypothetical protein
MVTNIGGNILSSNAYLTVVPTVPLPFALNTSNLTWTTDLATPWYGQVTVSHDGVAAARSYFIGNAQQTLLTTTVTGPATLSFWWKVSSQTNADIFSFADVASNFTNRAQVSGQVDWVYQNYLLPPGPQTLQWAYAKAPTGSSGLDAAFLDQVSITPRFTLPSIVTQPTSVAGAVAVPVTFTVAAAGTPILTYQWRFNGADIPGATSNSFTLAGPSVLDSGYYSVRVANDYGSIVSVNAYLGIVPLIGRGDDSQGQTDVPSLATNLIAVAAGAWHSLALRADGTVLAWGDNYQGQCNVANLRDIMAIAGGGYHSLAIQRDGTVIGLGSNDSGQATPPAGLSNITAIAAGTWHSLALRADGTVVAWGDSTDASGNFAGESVVPFGRTNVAAIGAGDYNSLAALANGSLLAWGDNSQGQSQPPATAVGIVGLVGGGGHAVALKNDSTVVAWGNDWNGQCDISLAVSNVVQIAAGNLHTLLLEAAPPAAPQLLFAVRKGGQFSAWVQTFYGKSYGLEFTPALANSTWTTLLIRPGNGARQLFVDPAVSGPQRFYRIRQF